MDTFIPPVTPSGQRLRRAARPSWEETLMRVATCEQVHPTIREFLDYYYDPRVVGVPFSDLPPSEAVLVWRTDDHSPAVLAFIQTAADVIAGRGKMRPSIASAATMTSRRSGGSPPSPSS
jgi:hypothetical protein